MADYTGPVSRNIPSTNTETVVSDCLEIFVVDRIRMKGLFGYHLRRSTDVHQLVDCICRYCDYVVWMINLKSFIDIDVPRFEYAISAGDLVSKRQPFQGLSFSFHIVIFCDFSRKSWLPRL